MSHFKKFLLNLIIRKCANTINIDFPKIEFVSNAKIDEIRELAKSREVFVLQGCKVIKYYYYSEPGNPFLNETYETLAEFIYSILFTKIKAKSFSLSHNFISQPEKCDINEVRKFIDSKRGASKQIEKIQASIEVGRYLSQTTFKNIDSILCQSFSKLIDSVVFNVSPKNHSELFFLIQGEWTSNHKIRNYVAHSYIDKDKKFDGEYDTSSHEYKVEKVIGNMIVTTVISDTMNLPKEERLLLKESEGVLKILGGDGFKILSSNKSSN